MYVLQRPVTTPSPSWEDCWCGCLDSRLHNCERTTLRSTTGGGGACRSDLHSPITLMGDSCLVCLFFAGWRCSCWWWHSLDHELPDLLQHSLWRACSCSHRPNGNALLTSTIRLSSLMMGAASILQAWHGVRAICIRNFKTSHRPERWLLTHWSQLSVAHLRPTLRSTTECTCRRDRQLSHRPNGKMADVLASTHASTTAADALVNYRMYVPRATEACN